ncbi:hypothetical protein Pst134EA_004892 [Puccinia striiformis f. sp. tritici]|uniref:hypothetical protein n=1 Tax=Puccinia striiformis f. sp. tritici TaxID=168172 RepID=UPI002007F69A|nr:hypothetical protein Pst134EA_004892 [Puccinia striiformis f. sp. tritici]KAH9470982.1 hypothetical protein Pst134EA_004892 [Puccinia striiformis f. sp. tritici]KAI9624562.1 hypothetical protein H4Q26_016791 [Puccinia striiformis f. sp. tritici PST-130]
MHRKLSHNTRATHPKPVGKFGRKAAVAWKSLKGWLGLLALVFGLIFLTIVTRKQSSLNKNIIHLDQRLRDLQEEALKMVEKIENLAGSAVEGVKRSGFRESFVRAENCCEMTCPRLNSGHESPAKKEVIYPKKDFAAFSAGASIIEPLTSPTWNYHRKIQSSIIPFYRKFQKISGSPSLTVLVSDLSLGTCWPFRGTTGQIGIQLSRTIRIEGITISHVSRPLAYDIRTAPKEFELWGLDHGSQQGDLLIEGTYSIDGLTNIQEFTVPERKSQLYPQVLLKIKTNHGNPDLTCIYRVHVHGEEENQPERYSLDYLTPT